MNASLGVRRVVCGWSGSVLVLAAVLVSGCGGGSQPGINGVKDAGTDALESVLESWKKGETPEVLKKGTPSISVQDVDWKAGKTLVGYRLLEEEKGKTINRSIRVELEIKGDKGKVMKKTVRYAVATSPTISVVRELF